MKHPLRAEYLRSQARILTKASLVARDMNDVELWNQLVLASGRLLTAAEESMKEEK